MIQFDMSAGSTKVALVLLLLSLLFTLLQVKKRLLTTKSLRFYAVAMLNTVVVLVLAAWLSNLSIKHIADDTAVLNSEQTGDAAVVLLEHPNLKKLTVKGYGLNAEQWPPFDGVNITHQPPTLTAGPVDLSWDRQILLGNRFTLSGRYQHTDKFNEIMTIKLLDPAGTVVNETRVKNNQRFKLSAIPKAKGHYQYRLNVVFDNGQLVNDEVIPVVVNQTPPAKLLVVQSAPSFESKHLKNWASEQGASLLLLTTISKEKFITQSVNMADNNNREFSPELLAKFDLLVMDGRALVNLSAVHQQWLSQAIDEGLGLYVMVDEDLAKAEQMPDIVSSFTIAPITSGQIGNSTTIPNWYGNHSDLAFDYMRYTIGVTLGVSLLTSTKNRVLSLYQAQGRGKVALSVLKNRYRWLLNGDVQTYTHYWQRLLSQLARVRSDSRFIAQSSNHLSLVSARAEICVLADKPSLKLTANGSELHLSTDRYNPYRQCAFYWPQSAGWQGFVLSDSDGNVLDMTHRYTFAPPQWQSWQQSKRKRDTAAFVEAQQQKSSRVTSQSSSYKPVNKSIYWWLLVFCASLLWLERKRGL